MKKLLFACVHNAGRSQMAAAFFNQKADPHLFQGISAGSEPAEKLHPEVLETMKEVGIDLSSIQPQKLTFELASQVSLLVTMGCGEACPYVPGLKRIDWNLEDPKGKTKEKVAQIRDEVEKKVEELIPLLNELLI